jgi:hypothetical protein
MPFRPPTAGIPPLPFEGVTGLAQVVARTRHGVPTQPPTALLSSIAIPGSIDRAGAPPLNIPNPPPNPSEGAFPKSLFASGPPGWTKVKAVYDSHSNSSGDTIGYEKPDEVNPDGVNPDEVNPGGANPAARFSTMDLRPGALGRTPKSMTQNIQDRIQKPFTMFQRNSNPDASGARPNPEPEISVPTNVPNPTRYQAPSAAQSPEEYRNVPILANIKNRLQDRLQNKSQRRIHHQYIYNS